MNYRATRFLLAAASLSAVAACTSESTNNVTNVSVPVTDSMENTVDTSGPCGDGTVLNENERCD